MFRSSSARHASDQASPDQESAAIFKRVWRVAAGEEEAPAATDVRRGWREVLTAAALQGAIFALVRAAVDRATAEGTRKLTGVWPGDDSQQEKAEEQP